MKYNFEKVSLKEQSQIYGGSVLSLVTAVAPLVISGVSVIANIVRMFTSKSGEAKTGTNGIKWNNTDEKTAKVEPTVQYKTVYVTY
ncbi:hypothetical protein [Mycoplasmopsis californica]|nr:hypothetical protein [Mycoplasmopsis californica]